MKAIRLTILLCTVIFSTTACLASPSIYVTTRDTQGGLFKINIASKQAERVDTYMTAHDFTSLAQYGSNQFLLTSYDGINEVMIFNSDGSLAAEYAQNSYAAGAIEKPNSGGDIYYAQHPQATIQLLDTDTGSSTLVSNTGFAYAWRMAIRSNGELYAAEWWGGKVLGIDSGTLINTNGTALYLVSDNHNNLYKNNGYNSILKIDGSNSVSTFWTNININLYTLAYDASEDIFYGLGDDLTTGYTNLYLFDGLGNSSLYLENISGLTGGYHGTNPAGLYSSMIVLNDGITTAIPEPTSMILLAVGFIGLLKKHMCAKR